MFDGQFRKPDGEFGYYVAMVAFSVAYARLADRVSRGDETQEEHLGVIERDTLADLERAGLCELGAVEVTRDERLRQIAIVREMFGALRVWRGAW